MTETIEVGENAPGKVIRDYSAMRAQQQTIHEWRVLNLSGDGPTVHVVDTRHVTCSCPDSTYNLDDDDDYVCKHLAYVYASHNGGMDVSDALAHDMHAAVDGLREAVAGIGSGTTNEAGQTATADDDGTHGAVTELDDVDDVGSSEYESLGQWFEQAAEFHGFDPDIIDISPAKADGQLGFQIERQPFDGGYYDDGEWQDKDGYEEQRDKVSEEVFQPRDVFEWYGEPDYLWFIPADLVNELTDS